jgi:alpha-galactosidase
MTTVCFVGAGSAVFTRQLLRDLLSYDDLGPLTLVMHDIDETRLQLSYDLALLAIARHGRPVVVRAERERRAALAGADFVINTVNVGGLYARSSCSTSWPTTSAVSARTPGC